MKRLKIGISARGLYSHFGGPFEYLHGFTREFVRQASRRHDLFLYYNTPKLLGSFPQVTERVLPETNYLIWDHLLLPHRIQRDEIDLALFLKGTLSLWLPCRAAVTMLDLGYFHPQLHAYKTWLTFYMRPAMRYAARRAWGIFTISEFTRQEVIRLLGAPPEKVRTIYGAADERYHRPASPADLERARAEYGLVQPFIFYPTSLSPRKNFPRLLDAFESVQGRIPHHLYFTGNIAWNTDDTLARLNGPLSARVHRLGSVPPEDMPALYQLSQFAIYPSLFEGLGLPILEAFHCGTPMMVSDQSCLPEVAGEAALIVDGLSSDALAQGLLQMASDSELRSRLQQAGRARVESFSWEKTVAETLDFIEARW